MPKVADDKDSKNCAAVECLCLPAGWSNSVREIGQPAAIGNRLLPGRDTGGLGSSIRGVLSYER